MTETCSWRSRDPEISGMRAELRTAATRGVGTHLTPWNCVYYLQLKKEDIPTRLTCRSCGSCSYSRIQDTAFLFRTTASCAANVHRGGSAGTLEAVIRNKVSWKSKVATHHMVQSALGSTVDAPPPPAVGVPRGSRHTQQRGSGRLQFGQAIGRVEDAEADKEAATSKFQ